MVSGVRFSSHIRFVSGEVFQKLPTVDAQLKKEFVGPPWKIHNRIRSREKGYTREIECCNAGGIVNTEQVMLFHLYPEERGMGFELARLQQALMNDIQELKRPQKPMRALLVGGDADDSRSLRYAQELEAIFKAHDIPYSIIWGHRRYDQMESSVFYSVPEDTWSIQTTFQKPGSPYLSSLQTPRYLRRGFSRIQIDPGDTVEVDGKIISAEQINHQSLKSRLSNWWHLPRLVRQLQETLKQVERVLKD